MTTGMLMVLGAYAVAIAAVIWTHWGLGQRVPKMTAIAEQLGWQFTAETLNGDDPRFAGFDIFRNGHKPLALNTLQGTIEVVTESGERGTLPVVAGDFQHTVQTDKGNRVSRFSYLLAALPTRRTGRVVIREEHATDKLAAMMGIDDIDFESQEFSDRFHVSAPNKRYAYDVLHPRMMQLFLEGAPPHVEVGDGCVCITDRDSVAAYVCKPEDFSKWIAFVEQFAELWPRHLTVESTALCEEVSC